MKNIRSYKKWNILAYIGILGMLLACADHMLQGDGNSGNNRQDNKNEELTMPIAKLWFENNYTPVITTRTISGEEWLCKPRWDEAEEYNRMQYEVVETPIYTHGAYLILDNDTESHWQSDKKQSYIRNNAHLVVLLNKKTKETKSFIMVFIGTYEYLKNTRTIGKNNYLYRQPDFSGSVLFYEINGTFINGWRYSEGKIIASLSKIANIEKEAKSSNAATRSIDGCKTVCYPIYGPSPECDGQTMDDIEFGTGAPDPFCSTVFLGYECMEDCYVPGEGDSGGSSSGEAGSTSPKTELLNKINGKKSTLTDNEKKDLEKALSLMNAEAAWKDIYNTLVEYNIRINFRIDSTIEGESKEEYDGTDRLILFASKEKINSDILKKEIFHTLQHFYYGTDFNDPNKKFTFEYEAHAFPDIDAVLEFGNNLDSRSSLFSTDFSPLFKSAVDNLMNSVIEARCFDDDQYMLYEKAGKIWKPLNYHGEFDSNIQPMILYNIFKK